MRGSVWKQFVSGETSMCVWMPNHSLCFTRKSENTGAQVTNAKVSGGQDQASRQGRLRHTHDVGAPRQTPSPSALACAGGPTGVRPQVAREGVPPAARVVAEMALEGLLPRVQLDVAQQVAFLREGGATLIALERPLSWEEERESRENKTPLGDERRTRPESCFPRGLVTSTGCRFDRT